MQSPGNDLEGIAGQVGAGCNLFLFVTGNGSITNFPFVPTLKLTTTTRRHQLLQHEMDINAGRYLDGEPMEALAAEADAEVLLVALMTTEGDHDGAEALGGATGAEVAEARKRTRERHELRAGFGEAAARADERRALAARVRAADDGRHLVEAERDEARQRARELEAQVQAWEVWARVVTDVRVPTLRYAPAEVIREHIAGVVEHLRGEAEQLRAELLEARQELLSCLVPAPDGAAPAPVPTPAGRPDEDVPF
jgi:hypothetical protein